MSEEDKAQFISDVKYFWNEKGDVTRFAGYTPEKMREADPVIADAIERYESAEKTLSRLLEW